MHRRLRHEAIGHGQAKDASHKRCATKEEEVPVETARLFERILFRLCRNAAHILA